MIHFHIITLFSESIASYLDESILGRAQQKKKLKITYYNIRDFSNNKRRQIDGKPYGGGPGMVMQATPILRAFTKAIGKKKRVLTILFTPRGKQFTNKFAMEVSKKYKDVILICGHYEGIDSRVRKIIKPVEISIGPYILTGGEIPAMCVIDSITRQIDGVLGNHKSIEEFRVSSKEIYTTPYELFHKGKYYKVPKVLISGHHKKIEEYRGKYENGA